MKHLRIGRITLTTKLDDKFADLVTSLDGCLQRFLKRIFGIKHIFAFYYKILVRISTIQFIVVFLEIFKFTFQHNITFYI